MVPLFLDRDRLSIRDGRDLHGWDLARARVSHFVRRARDCCRRCRGSSMKVLDHRCGAGFIGSTVASKCGRRRDRCRDPRQPADRPCRIRPSIPVLLRRHCGRETTRQDIHRPSRYRCHSSLCAALIVVGDSVSSPGAVLREQRLQITGAGFECPSERGVGASYSVPLPRCTRRARAGVSTNPRRSNRRVPTRTAKLSSKPCSTTSWQQQICRRYLSDTSIRSEQIRNCEAEHHRHARRTHSESSSNHIRQEHLSK